MNCHKVNKLLISFLDHDLSEDQKVQVEKHIQACPHCQKEKKLLMGSWHMLESFKAPEMRHDFTSSLMKRIHLEDERKRKFFFKFPELSFNFDLKPLVPVLATLIVTVLVTYNLWWKKPIDLTDPEKVTVVKSQEIAMLKTDDEIIQNLDILKDFELLENLDMLAEFDDIEAINDSYT